MFFLPSFSPAKHIIITEEGPVEGGRASSAFAETADGKTATACISS